MSPGVVPLDHGKLQNRGATRLRIAAYVTGMSVLVVVRRILGS